MIGNLPSRNSGYARECCRKGVSRGSRVVYLRTLRFRFCSSFESSDLEFEPVLRQGWAVVGVRAQCNTPGIVLGSFARLTHAVTCHHATAWGTCCGELAAKIRVGDQRLFQRLDVAIVRRLHELRFHRFDCDFSVAIGLWVVRCRLL